MGFFDFLKKSAQQAATATTGAGETVGAATAEAATAGAATSAEENAIMKLLGARGGQLTGLLDKLNVGGLDDVVKSWIGKGENKPVSAEQVQAALGPEEIGAVAQELGVSENDAAGKIAQMLPSIIDKLTPDGLVPDPDALAKKLTGFLSK